MGKLIFKNKKTNVLVKTTRNNIKFRQVAIKGDDGAPGVGISSILVNQDNDFIVTYTDGRVQNAGRIQEHDPNIPVLKQEFYSANGGEYSIAFNNPITGILILTLNGVQLRNITDYSVQDNIIYFTEPLEQNDEVIANYSIPLSSIEFFDKKYIVDNIAGGNNNSSFIRVLLAFNEVKSFSGTVIMKDKNNLGHIASWKIDGCISKFDTNASVQFVGQPTISALGLTQTAIDNGFDIQLSTDSVNGALQIKTQHNGNFFAKTMAILTLNEFV